MQGLWVCVGVCVGVQISCVLFSTNLYTVSIEYKFLHVCKTLLSLEHSSSQPYTIVVIVNTANLKVFRYSRMYAKAACRSHYGCKEPPL